MQFDGGTDISLRDPRNPFNAANPYNPLGSAGPINFLDPLSGSTPSIQDMMGGNQNEMVNSQTGVNHQITPTPEPQTNTVSTLDQDKVVAAVVQKWSDMQKILQPRYFFMQECQLAWERKWGETWNEISDGRSHRFIPKAFQTVETAVSQYLQQLMPNPHFFDVKGRTKNDNQNSPSVKAKLLWDHYRTGFRKDFGRFVHSACVHGVVPWTVQWQTKKAMFSDEEGFALRQQLQQLGLEVEVNDPAGLGYPTQEKTTFEGTKLVVGDPFNFAIDRHADDPEFAFRVNRTLQTYEFIKAKWGDLKDENGKPIYRNLDKLTESSHHNYQTSDAVRRAIDASMGYSPIPEDRVELFTFCGDLQIPGTGFYHNIFGVIANREHLLRFSVNPYAHGLPPWQLFTLIPDSYDPCGYGPGLIEPSLGLFDLVNVRVNQVVDANALAISPPLGVVRDGITDYNQIVWGPMEQIVMKQPGNVTPMLVPKEAMQLAMPEINYANQEIANTSGAMSGSSGGNASVDQAQAAQVGAVSGERIKNLQAEGLTKILKMQLSLNQQLMDPNNPILVRLEADESDGQVVDPATGMAETPAIHWASVGVADIGGDFDFEVVGSDTIQQDQQMFQGQIQFMNSALQDPEFGASFSRKRFYLEAMKMLKFDNAASFVKTPEEIAYDQQQQQLQQQAMGQPGTAQPAQGGGSPPRRTGVSSTPGNAGGGGSGPRQPSRGQLVGPTSNAGR